MDSRVQLALETLVGNYAKDNGIDNPNIFCQELKDVFALAKDFEAKLQDMDEVFDNSIAFEELREECVDLLLVNFFSEDASMLGEDYLESREWEEIEERTIDRGTELLNILLYIDECLAEEIVPNVEDFLNEFLLVEDDDFQEECAIYECIIENQMLVESTFSEIAKTAKKVSNDPELGQYFYAIMSFFSEPRPNSDIMKQFEANAQAKTIDTAIYGMLVSYYTGR